MAQLLDGRVDHLNFKKNRTIGNTVEQFILLNK